jgi:hypothetical protein
MSRDELLKALQSSGVPCSAGYGFSLHQQPFFRNRAFGPYLPNASVDYSKTKCPNSELLCREQAIWLEHNLLLGSRNDMDYIARAFEKALKKS